MIIDLIDRTIGKMRESTKFEGWQLIMVTCDSMSIRRMTINHGAMPYGDMWFHEHFVIIKSLKVWYDVINLKFIIHLLMFQFHFFSIFISYIILYVYFNLTFLALYITRIHLSYTKDSSHEFFVSRWFGYCEREYLVANGGGFVRLVGGRVPCFPVEAFQFVSGWLTSSFLTLANILQTQHAN